VDWQAERASLHGRVLLPILGDTLENVIERDELSLVQSGDRIRLKYFDHTFPLEPGSEEQLRGKDLSRWHRGNAGRERVRALLNAQHYRLAFWKRASIAINYRRFFDINELVALRMHDPAVFRETHALILQWIEERVIDGVRIDHIDGLLDPKGYLERLHLEMREVLPGEQSSPFIVVEKILSSGEHLRAQWPVQGTTGYEVLNDLEAVFVDADGAARLEAAYQTTAGGRAHRGFHEAAVRGKGLVLRTALTADVAYLVRLLRRALPKTSTTSATALASAIRHYIAMLPVYRTYIDRRASVAAADRRVMDQGISGARKRWGKSRALDQLARLLRRPASEEALAFAMRLQQVSGPATAKGVEDTALYRYVPLASLNEVGGDPARDLHAAVATLHDANAERARRWPRSLVCTSTHDTKRSADVRSRLDVLSEMPDEWIRLVQRWRRLLAPHRSEVRRGQAPDNATEWLLFQSMLGIWPLEQGGGPQQEVRDRIVEYMTKANREAKVRTSWTAPDEGYEQAVEQYVDAALGNTTFVDEMQTLVDRIARAGFCNALSRLLIHLTAPGTPDIYHGDELWNFALVDPDNRRPVDFDARQRTLDAIDALIAELGPDGACAQMLANVADGRLKMHVTRRALRLRRERTGLFAKSDYVPLRVRGERAHHAFGFCRVAEHEIAITLVTRLPWALSGGTGALTDLAWNDEHVILPGTSGVRRWRCVLTGRTLEATPDDGASSLAVREAFLTLPVALLVAA
jgi:(1->4)-alpha-D-glucan 1-alpha-D-glucosylmutase